MHVKTFLLIKNSRIKLRALRNIKKSNANNSIYEVDVITS